MEHRQGKSSVFGTLLMDCQCILRLLRRQIQNVSKTYMTRVEGENTRLRHYLARLHRKTLCYSKSIEMLKYSIRLLLHYLKYKTVPLPV